MARGPSKSGEQKQYVVDSIQQKILSGELQAGDPLRQIQLSEEYGTAQTVIRESLFILEQQGLVSVIKNQGAFVRELGKKELLEAYQVREVLEGLAARLCCHTASRADIEWLEDIVQRIYEANGKLSRSERSDLEYQFHQKMLELSRNETLIRQSMGYRFVGNRVATDRNAEELLKEHSDIVRAIAENKPDEAEKLARVHVARSAASIREMS